jgi:cell wall-associated NlpC family hydrolase
VTICYRTVISPERDDTSNDMNDMKLTNDTTPFGATSTIARRLAVAAVAVLCGLTGALVLAPSNASAADAGLPTNTMAALVTSSARRALWFYGEFVESGSAASLRGYDFYRDETAANASLELGYPEAEMVAAWKAAPVGHQRAVLAAMTQVGVPYRTNTSNPGVGFDCSGLTTYAWSIAGVALTRQSSAQIREALPLDRSTAKAGDLVQYPGHVMMYLGVGDAVIHSVQRGRTVELDTINERRTNSVRFGDPTI